MLEDKTLLRRVIEKKRERETANIHIVDYDPGYQEAFRALNEEWITTYFKMEEADHKALDHPQEYILDRGAYTGCVV